jgi:lipopolysaccharide biosynthesis protein
VKGKITRRAYHKTRTILGQAKHRYVKSKNHVVNNTLPYTYAVDNPTKSLIDKRIITIDGWVIPKPGHEIKAMRINNEGRYKDIVFGLKRSDVAKAFPDNPLALESGFLLETEVIDGLLTIEIDLGSGFKRLYEIKLKYSPELAVNDLFNPALAQNFAEHLNLMECKKQYFYEEPIAGEFVRHEDDPRLIAFYLPQFHPIYENDKAWGKGFTEWTNVASDTPRFIGHRQPILPKDMGFYDLRLEQNILDQISLAKKNGIYGFCFYYYWFSGKQLLETPINSFLKHSDWDFNFAICWANENWTKRWDGRDSEVIIAQQYTMNDPLKFIKDVEHILLDPRYIREDGKPLLLVYRASELKQPKQYAQVWRDYFRVQHHCELKLISIISFEDVDPREYGFDSALDFAPQSYFFKNDAFSEHRLPTVDVSRALLDKNFSGTVADYRAVALNKKAYDYFNFPIYKCLTPSWDNDARKKGRGFVMYYESPDIYSRWLDNILAIETSKSKSPTIFINAWNEWAEGAILEPTLHYGSAILNRTTEILAKYSLNNTNSETFKPWGIRRSPKSKLAVVLHLYYPERWDYLASKLELIKSQEFDLFVSLNEKDREFEQIIKDYKSNAFITIVPNRGRDILPFLHLLPRLKSAGYSGVLKLHSKKTEHRSNGGDWFVDLVDQLLPNADRVKEATNNINNHSVLIGPSGHFVSLKRFMGSNEPNLLKMTDKLYGSKRANTISSNIEDYGFFAGSMFWSSIDLLDPLIELYLLPEDFESEKGQIDGTLAHAVERLISLMAQLNNGKIQVVSSKGITNVRVADIIQDYDFAD